MTLTLTLTEAFEILTGKKEYTISEFNQALRLGIQAMKWIKEERELQGMLYPGLLPGETAE